MNAKQFAWLYLLEQGGVVTDGDHIQYGLIIYNDRKKKAIQKIQSTGVDWNKTEAPKDTYEMMFMGTEADSERKEFLEGTLVLTDGTEQRWMAEAVQIKNIFELLEHASVAKEKATKYFGTKHGLSK